MPISVCNDMHTVCPHVCTCVALAPLLLLPPLLCPSHMQYLKSIRLERNRKTGFKCPRGCGKGTQHSGPCPGKIDKSHPIHPRNEEQKKKKKVCGQGQVGS